GWSQSLEHLLRGRLITAFCQWRQFYYCSPDSRWTTVRKLFLEPLVPDRMASWGDRRRRPHRVAPWQDHAAIKPEFAAATAVDTRAKGGRARFPLSHAPGRTGGRVDARRLYRGLAERGKSGARR